MYQKEKGQKNKQWQKKTLPRKLKNRSTQTTLRTCDKLTLIYIII